MGRLLSRHQLPNIGCGVRCVRMLRPFLKIFRAPSTSRLLTRAKLAQVSGGFQPRVTSSNHVFGIRLRPVIEHERFVPLLLVVGRGVRLVYRDGSDAFGLVNETTETDSGLRRAQSALLT